MAYTPAVVPDRSSRKRRRNRNRRLAYAALYTAVAAVLAYLAVGALTKTDPPLAPLPPLPPPTTAAATTREADVEPHMAIRWPTGRPLRVLFIGDSLTAGYGATTEGRSFKQIVLRDLERHGQVEPLQALRREGAGLTFARSFQYVPPNADLAVVELGTNDVGNTPAQQFARDYRRLIDRIRADGRTQLVCLTPWRPVRTPNLDAYLSAIDAACTGPSISVDIEPILASPYTHGPEGRDTWKGPGDDFHPNDEGHRRIADFVELALGI